MRWLMALLFFAGTALAGSDGPWFPWPNMAGAGMFAAFAALAGRQKARRR